MDCSHLYRHWSDWVGTYNVDSILGYTRRIGQKGQKLYNDSKLNIYNFCASRVFYGAKSYEEQTFPGSHHKQEVGQDCFGFPNKLSTCISVSCIIVGIWFFLCVTEKDRKLNQKFHICVLCCDLLGITAKFNKNMDNNLMWGPSLWLFIAYHWCIHYIVYCDVYRRVLWMPPSLNSVPNSNTSAIKVTNSHFTTSISTNHHGI